jgi:geranylgeranyl transferase type-1 subunit beta
MESLVDFHRHRHIQYFLYCLQGLPKQYVGLETNRMTLVHFCIQSLDILGFLDLEEGVQSQYGFQKKHICEWIYSLQTIQKGSNSNNIGGFKGSNCLGGVLSNGSSTNVGDYDQGHIAMTYTALCTLITLGDNLDRVDKNSILEGLRLLQQKDGSFKCLHMGSENDLRFLYCACAISYILGDWSAVDKDKAVEFIKSTRSFDGAMSLAPGLEGHGGSLFCGVASLVLMGRENEVLNDSTDPSICSWREEIIHWCVNKQKEGMQGRPNKREDTCYSFWIGGTLHLLESQHLLDEITLTKFVLYCQTDIGGFSKFRDGRFQPDLLHSFYSLCWLSTSNDELNKINFPLGIVSKRIHAYRSTQIK